MVTSGLRIGTPALATRGFGEADFAEVADIIAEALIAAPRRRRPCAARVTALAAAAPALPRPLITRVCPAAHTRGPPHTGGARPAPARPDNGVRVHRRLRTSPVAISVFDLFTIGIGPSSSHTVGPMRAAAMFAAPAARPTACSTRPPRVRAELFGSLGATGHGHGTPKAVLLGLEGDTPRHGRRRARPTTGVERDPRDRRGCALLGAHEIAFDVDERPGPAPPQARCPSTPTA